MFFRHQSDKLIYPIIAAILLVVFSYHAKYRLNPQMPRAFFSSLHSETSQKPSVEQRIAWAYWESAQMDVQWKYAYGHPLPTDPPIEFRINAQALGPGAADSAVRELYWHRLQQVWIAPESWKKTYEWDFSWALDPFAWIKDHVDQWLSLHSPR